MNQTLINDEVFTHLHTAVILVNRDRKVLYMNPAAERLLAVSLRTARNRKLEEFFSPEGELLSLLRDVLATGRTIKIRELEMDFQKKSHTLQVELAPIGVIENPSGVLIWMEELSMAQALQEVNRMQDRLSMMGTMASGLAHEIRNPLGGIRGAAQMLLRESDAEERKEYLQMITSEVDRMNDLIGELLDFAKPKRIKKGPVNIHKILSEIFKMEAQYLKEHHIKLVQKFDPSLPEIYGHAPSLKQALLNVLKNAREAMPTGGTLTVGTHVHTPGRVLIEEGQMGTSAEISIKDTGPGIPKKEMDSLFTPFFSTKAQGTGLGLMMVQRILKEHRGSLKVESHPGKGTHFRLFLRLASPGS